ncbi:hypothetical protein Bca52824_053269 [Brassica carinata]|uniref:DUF4283 domain-containing protein n=1 Tax=Brassica carinata TaxID=52824 RepID=A0A8X7R3W2_BRACI|nr:hypothetical protein Bca52824_053269 [Brassica carinata]
MTQSQLLGNVGEGKNGEGTRKRLKISVPHFDNSALIKTFSKTLIGRCMNTEEQEMKALISNLPKIWKLEEKVVGSDLGFGKFQFDFDKVEDLEGVLKLQPFHFDYWMLSLARWQPKKSVLFPSEITFWVRIIGVPGEFKTVPTFESIGDAIGRTVAELCFETTVDFTGGEFYDGEEAPVSLRYEKLFGYCQVCGSLCHKDELCPLDVKNTNKSPEKKREGREGNGAWYDGGKYDDRARSYKGVVINGNQVQQNKERESREYYSKGKGKMGEEADSKWTKVAERGCKRAYTNRGTHRGDGEASRYRTARKEDLRSGASSGQTRPSTGQNREQQPQHGAREEAREEGEIRSVEECRNTLPSQAFQVDLAKTQAEGSKVISDPIDVDQGLAVQEDQVDLEEEDVMDMDEIKAHLLENEIDMDAEDFMEKLSEEEIDEEGKEQEDESNAQDTDEVVVVDDVQGKLGGDAVKKHGLRKRLFKSSSRTVGSTKMRPGARQGDTGKHVESKGVSNPKLGNQRV